MHPAVYQVGRKSWYAMEQIAVPWSIAVEPTEHAGRTVAIFLLKPEAEPYSPLRHQHTHIHMRARPGVADVFHVYSFHEPGIELGLSRILPVYIHCNENNAVKHR
jgi:hypothetical protein